MKYTYEAKEYLRVWNECFEKNQNQVTDEVKEDLIDFFLLIETKPMRGKRSCDDAITFKLNLK